MEECTALQLHVTQFTSATVTTNTHDKEGTQHVYCAHHTVHNLVWWVHISSSNVWVNIPILRSTHISDSCDERGCNIIVSQGVTFL